MLHDSFRALVQAFVGSEEFSRAQAGPQGHPIPLPRARIDVHVDASSLAAAFSRQRAVWSRFGEERPHFSVLTDARFLPGNFDSASTLFWSSGLTEANRLIQILASHGVSASGLVCVEYGCGVGRVTGALAPQFGHVHGIDISPSHLAVAARRIAGLCCTNVSLSLCSDTGAGDLPPCDVYYSRIVLQHNPPPLIHALVRAALAALNPGGLAIFQVPTYATGYSFDMGAWLAAEAPQDMEMHCLPQRYIFQAISDAGCIALEVREDDSTGDSRYISNLFVVQRPMGSVLRAPSAAEAALG